MKKLCFALVISLLLQSCDYIDPAVKYSGGLDSTSGGGTDTNVVVRVRNVLVEDFTGHTCGNCPKAAAVIDSLHQTYGDKVIPMAIHAGGYADPFPPDYPSDFRTPEGTAMDQFFGISAIGNPNGMVNRLDYTVSNHIKAYTEWRTLVAAELAKPIDAYIKITNTWNASSATIQAKIEPEFINAMSGEYKLCVFLTEDSIVADQKDYRNIPLGIDVHVHEYEHKHMLRASFVGGWLGESIVTDPAAGAVFDKTYNLTVNPAWNMDHCYVVAYIYNATTYQVVQADQKKVK